MTSTSGWSPLSRSRARCSTPNRCCSSMIARPSCLKRTSPCTSAWVPTTRWIVPASISASCSRRRALPVAPVSSPTRNRDACRSREMLKKCWSARISVGAMKATCSPFSIATSAARSATMVFPAPTSPCEQAVHRLRPLQVLDDFLQCLLLTRGELERQHSPRGFPNAIVDADRHRLALARSRPAARHHARLEQERFFEDQPLLRRRGETVQGVDRRAVGRKVRGHERRRARGIVEPSANRFGKVIGKIGGQALHRVVDQLPLNLRRDASRLLVHRHDAARVHRFSLFVVQNFVLRVGELQAAQRASRPDRTARRAVPGRRRPAEMTDSAMSRAARRSGLRQALQRS